jgi:hypothetical protein
MMNRTKTLILLLTLFSLSLAAQQEDDSWFSQKKSNPRPTPPPPSEPGVPLDGGLIGLIAAGGALGYKKYKARNSDS